MQRIVARQLFEDGPALLIALEVLAVGALAVCVARDTSLETLAVLLETPAAFAAAALGMPVFSLAAAFRGGLQVDT